MVLWAVVSLLGAALDLGVGLDRLAAATLGLMLLSLCFGSVALAAGAASGRRAPALGVAAGVAVVTYLLEAVVSQIDALHWLNVFSLFHYYLAGDPLVRGFAWLDMVVLALVSAGLLAAGAVVAFDRRDLGT